MGRRGPKPEPASVKKAKGNSGRRRIGEDPSPAEQEAALAEGTKIAAPDWLTGDGLEIWNRLAPQQIKMKLLGAADAEAFGRYCKNFARWICMQKRLDDMGEIYEIETASGKVRRPDPAYMIADRLERQLVASEAVFGRNPAERQRLFAARAAGSLGDLFDPKAHGTDAAGKPSTQSGAKGGDSPLGFLN